MLLACPGFFFDEYGEEYAQRAGFKHTGWVKYSCLTSEVEGCMRGRVKATCQLLAWAPMLRSHGSSLSLSHGLVQHKVPKAPSLSKPDPHSADSPQFTLRRLIRMQYRAWDQACCQRLHNPDRPCHSAAGCACYAASKSNGRCTKHCSSSWQTYTPGPAPLSSLWLRTPQPPDLLTAKP